MSKTHGDKGLRRALFAKGMACATDLVTGCSALWRLGSLVQCKCDYRQALCSANWARSTKWGGWRGGGGYR
eukprot:800921-Heterocapsa_arctica.AAC.1